MVTKLFEKWSQKIFLLAGMAGFTSLVRREGNYQMMKAEVSLGYPKPHAFKYLAADGGIVPAFFPQGRTNSLVKYILSSIW